MLKDFNRRILSNEGRMSGRELLLARARIAFDVLQSTFRMADCGITTLGVFSGLQYKKRRLATVVFVNKQTVISRAKVKHVAEVYLLITAAGTDELGMQCSRLVEKV